MKIQLSEIDQRVIERVCNIILEDTGIDNEGWIEVDDLLAILDSLEDSYKDLEDEYNEYKENIKDNYKPIGEGDNYRYYANTIQKLDEECNRQWNFICEKGLKEEYENYNS